MSIAVQEAFDHYLVFIMFRHLHLHEMHHASVIEQLFLNKDWEEAARGPEKVAEN